MLYSRCLYYLQNVAGIPLKGNVYRKIIYISVYTIIIYEI